METKQNIKGIYSYSFTITTMFKQYSFTTHKHNLVTTEGMNFIFSKLLFIDDEESGKITSNEILNDFIDTITLGRTEATQALLTDKYTNIAAPFDIVVSPYIDEHNCIVFSSDTSETEVTGGTLTGDKGEKPVTEIGLTTSLHQENSNTTSTGNTTQNTTPHTPKLITHDIHEPLELPPTAKITVEYKLFFDVGNYLKGFTKVLNNLYEYEFDKEIIGVKNLDNFYNYAPYTNTIEEMDTDENAKGTYKQAQIGDKVKLYIRTEDDYSPNGKNIVVYNSIYKYEEEE